MSTPIDLKPINPKPRQEIIRSLEKALEQAKSGEMRGFLMVSAFNGGLVCHSGWIDCELPFRTIIGELELCKHNFIAERLDVEGIRPRDDYDY
jgi:hypothetical protein